MKRFLRELLQDKNGRYNLRELTILVLLLVLVVSWLAQQFFRLAVPEFMFYGVVSLLAAGCFGYSIERKTDSFNQPNNSSS